MSPKCRLFSFDLQRAIFLIALHRLPVNDSGRFCDKGRRDYDIPGRLSCSPTTVSGHAVLGQEVLEKTQATQSAPRCNKDLLEEALCARKRCLCSTLDLVLLESTTSSSEVQEGKTLPRRGLSNDSRPDLRQMVVGVLLDDVGMPRCWEMWPNKITDRKALDPVLKRVRKRFGLLRSCLLTSRGMINAKTLRVLEDPACTTPRILWALMRQMKEIREQVLALAECFREASASGKFTKAPWPLKTNEIAGGRNRYVVCLSTRQAAKDAAHREMILD